LEARLNYARSLIQLNRCAMSDGNCPVRMEYQDRAQFLTDTLQQAQALGDGIAESYALGQLGEQSEQVGQWPTAQSFTQQALLKAEALQAADVRYRWEWQLGRLLQKQGDSVSALAAYQAAVRSLQTVRNDLLSISADVQFSFRDDVEPVYRELVELLLATQAGEAPSQENLKLAIQQVNALQLAELNNFLGCNIAQVVELGAVEADLTAAKLYPMILPNKLAVVLELPGQPLHYHEIRQPRSETLAALQQLRRDLSAPDRTPEALSGLQQLYQWLMQAFQPTLAHQPQIKTLVFVLDGELRNVPMSALYDGQHYLVKQYAVAVAPRLELFQPSPRPAQLKVFLGGIGEPQTLADRAFPEIQYLTPELEQIQQLVKAQQPLLNQAFTETNLEQQLQAGKFSAVHLKTHGIFSSDPEQTFIVAYQELITGRDLGRLIQLGRLGEASPIELLVLSACSTAQGDNRAVLGLAGVAVQAGARSVISTLWEAQDLPNTQLMIRFYQELLNPQLSRAEALRQAQLHLWAQGYTTPHVWATYVLVGNWL
jgi:CHAT domain-containing protein